MIPHDYQIEAIELIIDHVVNNKSFLLGFEPGLGKTLTTLFSIQHIINKKINNKKFLIVGRKSNLNDPWAKEIELLWRKNLPFLLITGKEIEKFLFFDNKKKDLSFDFKKNIIILTSYETFLKYKIYLNLDDFCFFTFDEIHNYTGGSDETKLYSYLTNSIIEFPKLFLTGTPYQNSFEIEEHRISSLLNIDFCEDSDCCYDEINKHAIFAIRSTHKRKYIPSKYEFYITLDTSELKKKEIDQIKNDDNFFFKKLPVYSLPRSLKYSNAIEQDTKICFLVSLVKLLPQDDKIIIYSRYEKTLKTLSKVLITNNEHAVIFSGQNTLKQRNRILNDFKNNPTTRILLITIGSGNEGINLQVANHMVIFEQWWNPFKIKQAIYRIHRQGQTNTVFIYHLIHAEELTIINTEIIKEESHNVLYHNDSNRKIEEITLQNIINDDQRIKDFITTRIIPRRIFLEKQKTASEKNIMENIILVRLFELERIKNNETLENLNNFNLDIDH